MKLFFYFFLIIFLSVQSFGYCGWNMTEKERKGFQRQTRQNESARKKRISVTDCSDKMLVEPKEENVVKDFTVAKIPRL